MPINPLTLPDPIKATPIDFTPFNKVGDAITEYKRRQQIGDAQAEATGPDGTLNQGLFGAALMKRGLSDEARPMLALAQQQKALDQTATMNAAQIENMKGERQQSAAALAEAARYHDLEHQQSAAALAETARHNQADENKPITQTYGSELVSRTGDLVRAANERILTPDEIDHLADQLNAGDASVLTNFGRGKQGPDNIVAIRQAAIRRNVAAGKSGADQAAQNSQFKADAAGMRTVANTNANIEFAGNTANRAIDLAAEASAKVPRGQFVPFNKLGQLYNTNMSSPEQADLYAKTNTLVNEYARFTTPKGKPTDSQRQHAEQMLNTAAGPEAYNAVLNAMRQEIVSGKAAGADTRDQLRANIGGGSMPPNAAAPGAARPGVPPLPPGFVPVQ